MKEKKKHTAFRLHPEMLRKLKNVSIELGRSQTSILEEQLEKFFKMYPSE